MESTSVTTPETGSGGCPVIHWRFGDGPLPALTAFGRMNDFSPDKGIVRVNEAQGYYLVTDHELSLEVLRDTSRFSTSAVIPLEPDPAYTFIPLMLDPPAHTTWRRLLAPYFTPRRAEAMSSAIRQRCSEIIDGFVDRGKIDFVEDFARRFPTQIFLELFGLPREQLEMFLEWEFLIMHPDEEADPERKKFLNALNEVMGYFGELIAERRADPDRANREDLISIALGWEIDGQPIPDEDLVSFSLFLFIAGLDTVTSQLGYMFHHLATNPQDRARIVNEPEIHQNAVEEFLRFHGIISTARKAVVDTELGGCPIKAGDMINIPMSGPNRDKQVYPDAAKFDLDREVTRHLSLGAGPHRCLGAHLARTELRIALDEWHKRIPDYSVAEGADILERTAGTWGLDSLPLVWKV